MTEKFEDYCKNNPVWASRHIVKIEAERDIYKEFADTYIQSHYGNTPKLRADLAELNGDLDTGKSHMYIDGQWVESQ
jgi:hypothetical protein